MSDEELKEEQDPEKDDQEETSDGDEDLHTEWIGEEEWVEDEDDAELAEEEEVPPFIDNGDGTISDTHNQLMWIFSVLSSLFPLLSSLSLLSSLFFLCSHQ